MNIGDRVRISAPGLWPAGTTGTIVHRSVAGRDWAVRVDADTMFPTFSAWERELTVVDE